MDDVIVCKGQERATEGARGRQDVNRRKGKGFKEDWLGHTLPPLLKTQTNGYVCVCVGGNIRKFAENDTSPTNPQFLVVSQTCSTNPPHSICPCCSLHPVLHSGQRSSHQRVRCSLITAPCGFLRNPYDIWCSTADGFIIWTSSVPRQLLAMIECSRSVLSNRADPAARHSGLLNTEELNLYPFVTILFQMYLLVLNLNRNSHVRLVAKLYWVVQI